MPATDELRLHRVSLAYPSSPPVLAALDFRLGAGERVGFVGPSGCGKSSLLRLAAGLLAPTSGRVEGLGAHETAFVFQDPTLLPWLDALDNVAVPSALRGEAKPSRRQRAREALLQVGLGDRLHHYPRQLSGGQRMRVSLARALSLRPQRLLLDEPFSALDELTRHGLHELLLELGRAQGWSLLLVTHSVAEAVLLCDRVIVMQANPGRWVAEFRPTLPRVRSAATRRLPEFHAAVDAISAALQPSPLDR